MLGDPLLQPILTPLLVSCLGVRALSLVNLCVTLVAECLQVGPLEAEGAAVLIGTSGLYRYQVMHAT